MIKSEIKNEAIRLRKSGKSYGEISRILQISKSTLSTWLKGIPLSETIKEAQITHTKLVWAKNITEFNRKRHEIYVAKTEETIQRFSRAVPVPTKRDLFFLFMGIFWGEGSKKEPFCVRVTNSDPKLIQASMRFLIECCDVPLTKFKAAVHLHHNNDKEECVAYWSNKTGISKETIHVQVLVSKASKGKRPINSLPYGTFNFQVYDVKLVHRIKGWLNGVITQTLTK